MPPQGQIGHKQRPLRTFPQGKRESPSSPRAGRSSLASSHAGTRPPIAVQLSTRPDTGPGRSPSACRTEQSFLALPSEKTKWACRRHARTSKESSTSLRRHDPHQVSGSKPNFLSAPERSPLSFRLEECPGVSPGRLYYLPAFSLCQSPFFGRKHINTSGPAAPRCRR